MTKLNQVIAIEKGVKSRTVAKLTELHKIAQKPALFDGVSRTYRPKDEDGEQLPSEQKVVQFRVQDILGAIRLDIGELIDITLQKDTANMSALADVKIDGKILLANIPVTTLLSLEKLVTDLRTFTSGLPVLDISESWDQDPNSGLYRTQPTETQRTKKVQKPLVLYPATDKHPAQTQIVTEDVIAGFWSTVKHSAAIPAPKKEEIVKRVDKLLIAIKEAREEANSIEANHKPPVGAQIFDYLLT